MAEAAAKALQSKLKRPTLLKAMVKSYVSGGFWLGGFGAWRRGVLPDVNTDLALERRGEHWPVRWLSDNAGLSGGWRTFALDQKLEEGDYMLLEKKDERVLKAFLFRAADYQDGATPEQDAFFEDAAEVDYKGRRVAAAIDVKEGAKAPAKRKASAATAAGGAAKKPRGGSAAAAAAAPELTSGSGEAAAAPPADGAEQAGSKRRNPARERGLGEQQRLQQLQELQAAAFKKSPRKAKAKAAGPSGRKPRAPADPNAPKRVRAPPKPKDPNAPPKPPRAPVKKKAKKTSPWDYAFPPGKMTELAEALKARHKEVCGDAIRVERKTGNILDGFRPGLSVNGYSRCFWERHDGTYRPIHVIFS